METDDFIPDGCRVQESVDGAFVRLGFYDETDTRNIILVKEQLPALMAQLQPLVGTGTLRPMNPAGVPAGTTFRLVGRDLTTLDDGRVRLTLHIKVTDGVRTIPMELSKDDAAELAGKLVAP